MAMIDRNSPIPIYVQIVEELRVKVRQAEKENREKFYTDDELMKMFNVSRLTIRQAVQVLVDENKIIRVKGSGTFLSRAPKKVASLESLDSFYDGFYLDNTSKADILFKGIIECPAEIANKLKIKPWSNVFYFERIRYIDGVPVVIDRRYMEEKYGKELTEHELKTISLVHLFPNKFKIKFIESEIEIEAKVADQETSEILKVDLGSPILFRYADMKGEDGNCLVVGSSSFRGDMYKYKALLRDH